MPNRIIKESVRSSRKINQLTDFQFRLWVYLVTYVDDYGRGSADPELIKGFVFPRRKRISESDIEKALAEMAGIGCIHLYKIDGESYFYFPNWSCHQRIQTKKSKFPEPPILSNQLESTVNHREPPPESNPIQIQSNICANSCASTDESLAVKKAAAEKQRSTTPNDMFDRFWSTYPKKRSKGDAFKAFQKLKPNEELLADIITAVKFWSATEDWIKENGKYIPYPATWLNGQSWLDERPGRKDDNCDPASGLPFVNKGKRDERI